MEACWVGFYVYGMEDEGVGCVVCSCIVVLCSRRWRKNECKISLLSPRHRNPEMQTEIRGRCEIITCGVDKLCIVANRGKVLMPWRYMVSAARKTVDVVEESWIGEFDVSVGEAF